MIICHSCNNSIPDDAVHCGYCGKRVTTDEPRKTLFGMSAISIDGNLKSSAAKVKPKNTLIMGQISKPKDLNKNLKISPPSQFVAKKPLPPKRSKKDDSRKTIIMTSPQHTTPRGEVTVDLLSTQNTKQKKPQQKAPAIDLGNLSEGWGDIAASLKESSPLKEKKRRTRPKRKPPKKQKSERIYKTLVGMQISDLKLNQNNSDPRVDAIKAEFLTPFEKPSKIKLVEEPIKEVEPEVTIPDDPTAEQKPDTSEIIEQTGDTPEQISGHQEAIKEAEPKLDPEPEDYIKSTSEPEQTTEQEYTDPQEHISESEETFETKDISQPETTDLHKKAKPDTPITLTEAPVLLKTPSKESLPPDQREDTLGSEPKEADNHRATSNQSDEYSWNSVSTPLKKSDTTGDSKPDGLHITGEMAFDMSKIPTRKESGKPATAAHLKDTSHISQKGEAKLTWVFILLGVLVVIAAIAIIYSFV